MLNLRDIAKIWSRYISSSIVYLPPIGLVEVQEEGKEGFLEEILSLDLGGSYKVYEPYSRWFNERQSAIDTSLIFIDDFGIGIPVVSKRGSGAISVYLYSNKKKISTEEAKKIINHFKESFGDVVLHVVSALICGVDPIKEVVCLSQDIQLPKAPSDNAHVKLYSGLSEEEKLSFEDIKGERLEGIQALWEYTLKDNPNYTSPIYCYVEDKKILGIVGPIDTIKDYYGKLSIPAPYFGVIPNDRRKGVGKALWQLLLNDSLNHGCKHLLLQTSKGSAAHKFYRSQLAKEHGVIRSYKF